MNEQSLVAVGGIGLIGATFWKSEQRTAIDNLVWNGKPSTAAKTALLQVAGESILVLILYLLAGTSDSMGLAMTVVVITLWVLFFIAVTGKQNQKG